jgi:REP element-mobilizing transposase RayT
MTQRRIYQEEYPYFITTNTLGRHNLFENTYFAAELYNTILKVCRKLHYPIYSFCIMPDHLHLLLGTTININISEVLQQIKSIYTKNLREKYNFNHPIWQKRFNSRIVDSEERLINTINYILYNPIKGGLDKKYQSEPYIYLNKKLIDSLFG